jgi:hypothetical protein
MCFVWVSEQRAIISLYSFNRLALHNGEDAYLLRGRKFVFKYNSKFFCV